MAEPADQPTGLARYGDHVREALGRDLNAEDLAVASSLAEVTEAQLEVGRQPESLIAPRLRSRVGWVLLASTILIAALVLFVSRRATLHCESVYSRDTSPDGRFVVAVCRMPSSNVHRRCWRVLGRKGSCTCSSS